MPSPWWQLIKAEKHCFKLPIQFDGIGSQRRILLLADLHWDNAQCRLDLLKRTLDEAQREATPVFVFGDFFCAMQGKWDKRADRSQLRPEHQGGDYLDALVETAVEWFAPYKDVLALVTPGNHETGILKHHETELIQRFVARMRGEGSVVQSGPYWGFLLAQMWVNGKNRDSYSICWHHGYGGGGEVTRGLIDHSRTRGQYYADAFVSGHIHRRNVDENIITRLSNKGHVIQKQQLFLRCSSFKDESNCGFHVERGRAARPIGGWWLSFSLDCHPRTRDYQLRSVTPIPT